MNPLALEENNTSHIHGSNNDTGMRSRNHSHQSHSMNSQEDFIPASNVEPTSLIFKSPNLGAAAASKPTSTLSPTTSSPSSNNNQENEDDKDKLFFPLPQLFCSYPSSPLSFFEVTKSLAPQFLAAFANTVLYFLSGNFIMASVGRNVDTTSLAAIGAGISLNNILGYAISIGFAAALDSLCSSAYGRLKKAKEDYDNNRKSISTNKPSSIRLEEIGEYTLLGMILCSCLCIPFSVIFWNAEPLARVLFGEQYSHLTGIYLKHAIPNLFVASWSSCAIKSCQAQQRADLPVIATIATLIVSIFTSIKIVPYYGVEGVAWCFTLNSAVSFVMIFVLALLDSCLFDRERFDEVGCLNQNNNTNNNNIHEVENTSTKPRRQRRQGDTGDEEENIELVEGSNKNNNNTTTIVPTLPVPSAAIDTDSIDVAANVLSDSSHANKKKKKPEVLLLRLNWFKPNLSRILTMENVKSFSKVGFATAKAIASEWLAFECFIVLSAHLGENAFASFQIFMNVAVICFALASGMGVAASSHVGGLLGEGKPLAAFTHGKTCIMWASALAAYSALCVNIFHEVVFDFYTHDRAVKDHLEGVLHALYFMVVGDHTQFVLQAAFFRGTNKNDEAPGIVLSSLWLVGLPMSYLCSMKFGLPGLIMGYCSGFVIEIPWLLRRVNTFDWNELARSAAIAAASAEEGGTNNATGTEVVPTTTTSVVVEERESTSHQ